MFRPDVTVMIDWALEPVSILFKNALTPSLPQSVNFPGTDALTNSIFFRSYNTSAFSVMRFGEILFTCQCKKEDKKSKGFYVSYFY